jgi:hypothetical protein
MFLPFLRIRNVPLKLSVFFEPPLFHPPFIKPPLLSHP